MQLYLDPVGGEPLAWLAKGLLRHDWVLEAKVNFLPWRPALKALRPSALPPLLTTVTDLVFAPSVVIPSTFFDRGRPDESLAERALETELSLLDRDILAAISQSLITTPYSVHVGRDRLLPFQRSTARH